MNAFFTLATCLLVVSYLDQATSFVWRTTTTTTSTEKTTQQTYRPEDLPATSDFPPSPDPPRNCSQSMPCGWAVYSKETRQVEYFTRNVCVCPEDKSCLRVQDDLGIGAYVFKCGPKRESTETYPIHW